MRITTSNVLLGVTPSVAFGGSPDDAQNITDPDFSTSYTSSSNNGLIVNFGSTVSINYVALAGLNIQGNKDYTSSVRVSDGSGSVISKNLVIRNNCIMLTFTARTFADLRITIDNPIGNILPAVRFVAAGTYLQIPNGGETGGYIRQFLSRNNKTKSTLSNLAAPTAVLTTKVAPKATLNLPNMTKEFSELEWQTFLDFTEANYFFISEQDQNPAEGESTRNSSSYLCFDVTTTKATAHAQTRALNNLSIKFKVFNGL